MKIAVTSQNFRTITPHAGRTRRFLFTRPPRAANPSKSIASIYLKSCRCTSSMPMVRILSTRSM